MEKDFNEMTVFSLSHNPKDYRFKETYFDEVYECPFYSCCPGRSLNDLGVDG